MYLHMHMAPASGEGPRPCFAGDAPSCTLRRQGAPSVYKLI